MLNNKTFGMRLQQQDNWCCNIDYNQDQEIVGFRKHIIPKSAQKNQKTQKISLKKRSDSNNTNKQTKKQTSVEQTKYQSTPPKPVIMHRNFKPPQPGVLFQQIQINATPCPTANYIKYAHEKPVVAQKKINFIYNNKVTPVKCSNLGEVNIVRHEKKESRTFNTTHADSAYRSFSPIDPCKSTQVTYRDSNKGESWDHSPGLSRDFRIEQLTPLRINIHKQEKIMLSSLSSRKHTVLSISGDSQSQESFAVQDISPLPFVKFNSIQSSKLTEQRQKYTHASLKSSINL